jgi:hypothetical protein
MAAATKRPPLVTASASGLSSFKQNAETHSTNTDTVKQQAAEQIADHAAPTGTSPTVHPVAMEFDLLQGEEFAELVADIKANGLIHPITLDKEGALLDGRNRLRACALAGVKPRFETYKGDDPVGFVISANIHRRHLTKEQKAEKIAAALAKRPTSPPLARSATRGEAGRLAGSTRDSFKSAVVEKCAEHDIGKRTAERALAKARPRPDTRARRGAARPSPRPAKQPAAVPSLDSRSWSQAAEKDKEQPVGSPSARERFLSAIGYDDWWHCAPEAFRERARREVLLATPSAPAGEIANDLRGAAKDDPLAIPEALRRTPATDRFGRARPEPGSRLKPDKKRGRQ